MHPRSPAVIKGWTLTLCGKTSSGIVDRFVSAIVVVAGLYLLPQVLAAPNQPRSRPSSAGFVTLRGNTRPEAKAENDRGQVAEDLVLEHMMLQLRRTPLQEQSLENFIQDLHDPRSPLFHHWITAAEFGQKYGASAANISTVAEWLQAQGFTVNLVYPNRMVIDFTGSAGHVRQAFQTAIHNLRVNGKGHIANMSDPQIPADLAPVVEGIVSLNDFRPQHSLRPRANLTAGGGGPYLVTPADLWTIYNFNPAFAAGISGQGQTIVLVEATDLYSTTDWDTFRSVMGLSSAYPTGSFTEVHPASSPQNNCSAPGVNSGEDVEAAVDAEWASAGAPSATIELASCSGTQTTWGGLVALQNLLNSGDTPPAIVSISYGESESVLGVAQNAFINSLYQQAVTEGVSVFVSSGDWGAAASDAGASVSVDGISVDGYASTPYNVAVGGTDFADTYEGNGGAYWNSTNSTNQGSALSYIPEIPWNESCASVLLADFYRRLPTYGTDGLCNTGSLNSGAGGGGPSGCATGAPDASGVVSGTCSGYAKPLWQSSLVGNPGDGVRDLPDVSLFASGGTWNHAYVFCFSDANSAYSSPCSGTPETWSKAGGTSFSAPVMAGIQALVNQASGSRWGNPNPLYYSLAAAEYAGGNATCNSALGSQAARNCVFHDVTQIPLLYGGTGTGGDIDVPCIWLNCYAPAGGYGALSTASQTLNYAAVTELGTGYTGAPSCTLSGGGGSGAACRAAITGVVSSVNLTNGGSGFTGLPTCTLTGGGGTGASCEVGITFPAGQSTGFISSVYLVGFGGGYTSAPTCTLAGGGGTGATCAATVSTGVAISLTSGGNGYTTMPHCILSGGGGEGAACVALAESTSEAYQPAFAAGPGWDFATGLGTVDAWNLVSSFASSSATLTPPSLEFSPQTPGASSPAQRVTVTNTGTTPWTVLGATVSGPNAADFVKGADECTAVPVSPHGDCSVSITFKPLYVGSRSAALNFTGIPPGGAQAVGLIGSGVGAGAVLSPTLITFPDQVVGGSDTQTVTLTNPGNLPLTLTGITITGSNSGDFARTNNCSSTVAAGGECTIPVTFTPGALGSLNATLLVADNGLDSPQSVSLRGAALNPVPFVDQPLSPTSIAPGSPGFTLSVTGAGFAPDATVNWNGTALATTYVSMHKLTAMVPAANISSSGTASITVQNAGLALVSDVVLFPVSASVPTVAFRSAAGSPLPVGGASSMPVVAGDFDEDGKLDLVTPNAGGASLTVWQGGGDGTFTADPASGAGWVIPSAIGVGDFNMDGKLDVASANAPDCNLSMFLGNGDGTLTLAGSHALAGAGPFALVAGDLNGDGKLDLALANLYSNNVEVQLGNGDGTFAEATRLPATGNQPQGIAIGDFNGDGKLDLAVTNELDYNLTILLGNGDGTFTVGTSPSTGVDPAGIVAGDFNGDGNLDLAVANSGSSTLTILLGNGDGTFIPAASPATGIQPQALAVGDFNSDGKLDLAVANAGSNDVTILLGNGDGTFITGTSFPVGGTRPWTITAGDFNGDGRLDLAIGNIESRDVTVMLQVPPPGFAEASPETVNFGNQAVRTTSAPQPVVLSNQGAASLSIAGITISGDFAQTNNCNGSVAANGSCAVNVTFTPAAAGPRSGTLTIATDGVDSPQVVALNGTGLAPIASLSPSAMTFAAEITGVASSAQTLTLRNSGTSPLAVSGIATTGDFFQSNTCGNTVEAGANCTISVTFKPTAGGTRAGALSVSDNAAGTPQTVELTGMGQDFTMDTPLGGSASTSVSRGQAATYTLSVGGEGGLAGAVSFACSGVPAEANCTISPNPAAVGNSPVNVTVTITTTAPGFAGPHNRAAPPRAPCAPSPNGQWVLLGALILIALCVARCNQPGLAQGRLKLKLRALGLLFLVALVACGGGGGVVPAGTLREPGTPVGTYPLTLTGTAGSGTAAVSHTVTLTLIVN